MATAYARKRESGYRAGSGGVMQGARVAASTEDREARRAAGKAKAAAAIERLDAGVRACIEDDDEFAEFLRMLGRMHNYSWGNRLLVHLQRPDAGLVAGFHAWRELGRPVRKGSKGIQILAPMVKKFRGEPGSMDDRGREYDDKGEAVGVVGFRVAYVFSVHDTDGPPFSVPVPVPMTDDGPDAREAFELLARRCVDFGVALDVRTGDDLGDGLDAPAGWYRRLERAIVVNAALPAGQRAAVLAHELAHHVAGKLERRDAETVAEGAAFAVAAYFGLDTSAFTVPYVAGWAQDAARVRGLLESVAAVSDEILSGLAACFSCGEAGCPACMV